MDDRTLVRAESLGRAFGHGGGTVIAVADATFAVEPEDRIAVVGPSGTGKTTLLHLIAGLDRPTSGSIAWPSLGERASLRPGPLAIAFQGPSLLPPLTVLENVALPSILAGGNDGDATAVAIDLLEIFQVDDVAAKLPEEISGGQAQRAALARAFVGSPRLVLADEPTGQQDRETAGRVVDAILTLAKLEGIALVVATHDSMVAERLAVRWSMSDGRLDDGRLDSKVVPCSA